MGVECRNEGNDPDARDDAQTLRHSLCPHATQSQALVGVVLVIWWHHRRAWPGPGKVFVHAMLLVQSKHLL